MLCANGNLPRKGQVRTDLTMRWSVIHTHLYSHRTRLCHHEGRAAGAMAWGAVLKKEGDMS